MCGSVLKGMQEVNISPRTGKVTVCSNDLQVIERFHQLARTMAHHFGAGQPAACGALCKAAIDAAKSATDLLEAAKIQKQASSKKRANDNGPSDGQMEINLDEVLPATPAS